MGVFDHFQAKIMHNATQDAKPLYNFMDKSVNFVNHAIVVSAVSCSKHLGQNIFVTKIGYLS